MQDQEVPTWSPVMLMTLSRHAAQVLIVMTISETVLLVKRDSPLLRGIRFFQTCPFLEVPGFEGKVPDLDNINILKNIRKQTGLSG